MQSSKQPNNTPSSDDKETKEDQNSTKTAPPKRSLPSSLLITMSLDNINELSNHRIARGSTAVVAKTTLHRTDVEKKVVATVAAKIAILRDSSSAAARQQAEDRIFNEAYFLNECKKRNAKYVVKIVKYCIDPRPCLFVEWIDSTLLNLMFAKDYKGQPVLDTEKALVIMMDISHALHELKESGIVHGDIKPENIFVRNDFRAKLGDFDTAQTAGFRNGHNIVGTLGYIAPELVENGIMTYEADMFSYGITFLEVAAAKDKLWYDRNILKNIEDDNVLIEMTRNGQLRTNASDALRRVQSSYSNGRYFSDNTYDMIKKCISNKPKERPAPEKVVLTLSRSLVFFKTSNEHQKNIDFIESMEAFSKLTM